MNAPARQAPRLPSTRAFVVQLYADTTGEPAHFRGRVEHIATGQATHFQTLAEFLAFIARLCDVGREQGSEEV